MVKRTTHCGKFGQTIVTYPPHPDPNNPPQFPTDQQTHAKQLVPSTQQMLRNQLKKTRNTTLIIEPGPSLEEVRRNKESFLYIIQNNLWYTEGLEARFPTSDNDTPISFPTGAIEVKAQWKTIDPSEKPNYHWNYDASGVLYGMLALHIMTKAIPNWTWATWEWGGNKGRCADMGCHDAFGVTPANMEPHAGADTMHTPMNTDTTYPPGELTNELTELFKKFGLGDEWKNYRLEGSQTDWIDATGSRPTLLGNSVLEDGFVNTSSCMTGEHQKVWGK